ncbi:hypothetical protein [Xenorhabdus siamensis]|uniref:hypothetical protein n=1 Tax=Xenorhabdus siamensis TaxID=3136254 RepID=UPI0030F415BD
MLRFLPKMFSSGRVYHNRLLVMSVDLLVIYAFYLSFRGYIHWAITVLMAIIVAAYYVWVSYVRFFKLVMENKLLKTNVVFDNGFIYASLIVEAKNIDDEPVEIPLRP